MTKLTLKLLAFDNAPVDVYKSAVARVEKLIPPENYELAENNPDILFFLTGGSEAAAVKQVSEGNFYVLIGSQHDNAYASATEVKTYLNTKNIHTILLDEENSETPGFLQNLLRVKQALKNLYGQKLGLIGQVSDWLIASAIPADILQKKFGINLTMIPWSELPHFSDFHPSGSFLDAFSGTTNLNLTKTARVNELLTDTIQKHSLDAITVECFPMVQKDGVTACLPLAKLNNDGIPAGCEGDLTAIAGMMLCRQLTGIIPWIANINKVSDEVCMFSHCTIPTGLVSDFTIKTHFETGKGTAIAGNFAGDVVTIFRFDSTLSKAFIATAAITGRPESATACRTQIEVKLAKNDVKLLRQNPLGNHHLVVPGDHSNILKLACSATGINVIN